MDRLDGIGLKELSFLLRCANAAKEMITQIDEKCNATTSIQLAANAAGKLDVLVGELSILREPFLQTETIEDNPVPAYESGVGIEDVEWREEAPIPR